jgi:hypothetical protein
VQSIGRRTTKPRQAGEEHIYVAQPPPADEKKSIHNDFENLHVILRSNNNNLFRVVALRLHP